MLATNTVNSKFEVIGLTIRTSNAKESSGEGQISNLWERYFADQIASQIPNPVENNIYAVYHSYESDVNGEYSLTVGLKVKLGTIVPAGLSSVQVPEQKYLKVTTDQGPMPGTVIEGWKYVWQQKDLSRAYSADFEVYDDRCLDPESAQIDIYIAIN